MGTGLSALPELVKQINAEHAACMLAAQDAVARAIGVGRLLAEAKGLVRHGEWSGWIEKHCAFGVRQAQKYSQAFQDRASIENQMRTPGAHLTNLNQALESVAIPKPKDSVPRVAATGIKSIVIAVPSDNGREHARIMYESLIGFPWGRDFLEAYLDEVKRALTM
jgi:hypothetical protein